MISKLLNRIKTGRNPCRGGDNDDALYYIFFPHGIPCEAAPSAHNRRIRIMKIKE